MEAGHFYSPIPSIEEIRKREDEIFQTVPREIPGLDLREQSQLSLLVELQAFYADVPFTPAPNERLRYFFENEFFGYSDAIFLYSLIRKLCPRRIIEIGCGHSSCVILDTNELHFDNSIDCTFIEPFPGRLHSLLKDSDRIGLIEEPLHRVPIEMFRRLTAGDFLFIDSTHVAKIGSDVNHIFANVLPALQSGVFIHFHDILYPFEYPKEWVYAGRAWNEAYVLRAFLQYNDTFRMLLFPNFLMHFHRELFSRYMPLCLKNSGGSLWLQKL